MTQYIEAKNLKWFYIISNQNVAKLKSEYEQAGFTLGNMKSVIIQQYWVEGIMAFLDGKAMCLVDGRPDNNQSDDWTLILFTI